MVNTMIGYKVLYLGVQCTPVLGTEVGRVFVPSDLYLVRQATLEFLESPVVRGDKDPVHHKDLKDKGNNIKDFIRDMGVVAWKDLEYVVGASKRILKNIDGFPVIVKVETVGKVWQQEDFMRSRGIIIRDIYLNSSYTHIRLPAIANNRRFLFNKDENRIALKASKGSDIKFNLFNRLSNKYRCDVSSPPTYEVV